MTVSVLLAEEEQLGRDTILRLAPVQSQEPMLCQSIVLALILDTIQSLDSRSHNVLPRVIVPAIFFTEDAFEAVIQAINQVSCRTGLDFDRTIERLRRERSSNAAR